MPYIEEDRGLPPAARISKDAERRIATGILVDGKPFRCDETSAQRIWQCLSAFQDGLVPPGGTSFRTAAGDVFTLTTQAQAQAIFDAQRRYIAAVLSASAALQTGQSGVDWPDRISITLD
ncbi:MAG: hypothetical protein R8L07_03365 [Alphaproteobacteria bacterium]|nr:hypothetical protein [Alphaproteobacteria bacterium]